MPKNKNKNKNTSGWPQSSLQCQMIGNNEVLYIYMLWVTGNIPGILYSANSASVCEITEIYNQTCQHCIIHVLFLKNLCKDKLMQLRDEAKQ